MYALLFSKTQEARLTLHRVRGTIEMTEETAIATGIAIEVNEDARGRRIIDPRDGTTNNRTLTPRVETTEPASVKTDMAHDERIETGTESGARDVVMMTGEGIVISLTTEEEAEVVTVTVATEAGEKTATSLQLRHAAARAALLRRNGSPLPISRILYQSWNARGD